MNETIKLFLRVLKDHSAYNAYFENFFSYRRIDNQDKTKYWLKWVERRLSNFTTPKNYILGGAFTFASSNEGYDFWHKILVDLKQVYNE